MSIRAFDDRDPTIVYSTGWAQAGSSLEYNSTTTWTALAGSTAQISFRGKLFLCPPNIFTANQPTQPPKPKRNGHWRVWYDKCQRQRLGYTRISLQHRWRPSSTLQSCPSSPSAIQPAVLPVPSSPRGGSCVDHHERGCESGPILPRFCEGAVQ